MRQTVLAVALVMLVVAGTAGAARATTTPAAPIPLGTFVAGGDSVAYGINARGAVVGYGAVGSSGTGAQMAVMWPAQAG